MTEHEFRAIYLELIDENPLAVRAVLKVLEIEFTSEVPTLAVTCTDAPVLKVNLGFVAKECAQEKHVKALIIHEFLHILLRHTMTRKPITPERHLATDAVINAIIHRQLGADYSGLMSHYYRDEEGIFVLHRFIGRIDEVLQRVRGGVPSSTRTNKNSSRHQLASADLATDGWG